MIRDWREAAKTAMRKAAIKEQETESAESLVLKSQSFNYRWEHVSAVVTLALKLAQVTGADSEVVEAAAWLHDVTKSDGENHAETEAEFAGTLLADTDFPQEKIDDVVLAIAEHKGLWREMPLINLNSMILWDADKLSKLGLTAVIQWTGMFLSREDSISSSDILALRNNLQWQRKTVESLHTRAAQQAGRSRLEAYQQFWDSLAIELKGNDIRF